MLSAEDNVQVLSLPPDTCDPDEVFEQILGPRVLVKISRVIPS